jgi:ATP-dependent DNA helicase RecG
MKILKASPMSLTELSNAMGYKGITAKLSKTVDSLINQNKLQLIIGKDKSKKLNVVE